VLLELVLDDDDEWLLLVELLLVELLLDEDRLVLLDDELELLLELDEELDGEERVSAVNSCVLGSARVVRPRTDRFAFVLRCGFRFICQLSGVTLLDWLTAGDSAFLGQRCN